LLKLLRAGTPKSWACRAIGVSRTTLENYFARAAEKVEPYRSFIRDVEQAQAGYVNQCLRVLDADAMGAPLSGGRERGNGDLKWILERLYPKDFGRRRRIEPAAADRSPQGHGVPRVVIIPAKEVA
jgi:hypothetical protein